MFQIGPFGIGDYVVISEDLAEVIKYQQLHATWSDQMEQVLLMGTADDIQSSLIKYKTLMKHQLQCYILTLRLWDRWDLFKVYTILGI